MRVLVANQKGGVLKTTVAVHLAHWLALQSKETLLVDGDSQGNCAGRLGVDPWNGFGLAVLSAGSVDDETIIKGVRPSLSLMSGSSDTGMAKSVLTSTGAIEKTPEAYFESVLAPYDTLYDHTILDAGPSWDIMNVTFLFWCETLIIPTTFESDSVDGALKLLGIIKNIKGSRQVYILPTKVDKRYKSTSLFNQAIHDALKQQMLPPISTNQTFENAARYGQTIFEFQDHNSSASIRKGQDEYKAIAKELFK